MPKDSLFLWELYKGISLLNWVQRRAGRQRLREIELSKDRFCKTRKSQMDLEFLIWVQRHAGPLGRACADNTKNHPIVIRARLRSRAGSAKDFCSANSRRFVIFAAGKIRDSSLSLRATFVKLFLDFRVTMANNECRNMDVSR